MIRTREDVNAYESMPAPDCEEFAVGAGEVDVAAIGGYPVRRIVVVAATGNGTLKFRTARSGTTNRTATLATGAELRNVQITSIRGTGDGTANITTIRVYK